MLRKHPREMMFLKPSSGIGRGKGKRARSSGGSAKIEKDIVFKTRRETEEEYRRRRGRGFSHFVSPEGLKAIADLPDGAEFTMDYAGFGSMGQSRFRMNKSDYGRFTRSITRIDEGGYNRSNAYQAKTNSQIRDIIGLDNARGIIIHNGGKSMSKIRYAEHEERRRKTGR